VNIGAVVVNESGEPVQDARVIFDVFGYQAPARSLDRERLTMNSHYHVEIADDHGRWHCSHVPAEFGMIRFKVAHPEYAPRDFGSAALGPTTNHGVAYLAQAELRNATAIMPLAQGAIAAGIEVDDSDRPVAGAKVTLSQQWAEPTANQITGPDGRFRFANIPRETQLASENTICFLTVQAEGYGPSDFQFKGSTPPAESRLNVTKGAELRGRVVDDHGEPVPRASIQICSHSNVRRFEWTTATDSDGRFKWESAPARAEFYIVEAPGFQPMSEFKWIPDGTEHLVTLHTNPPPVLITGDVVDDLTGIPVDNSRFGCHSSKTDTQVILTLWRHLVPSDFAPSGLAANSFSPTRTRFFRTNCKFAGTAILPPNVKDRDQ